MLEVIKMRFERLLIILGLAAMVVKGQPVLEDCGPGYSSLVSQGTGRLNTEQLAAKFGPISTEIHSQKGGERQVWFKDAKKIARGFASSRILYDKDLPTSLYRVHQKILSGGSMGKSFKEAGFTIRKENLVESSGPLPEPLREPFNAATGTRRNYRFVAVNAVGQTFPYADVEEWTPE